jgi:REP element-mobilizing transposase RayT
MGIARRLLVPEGVSRCYHCLSRCVRRAFLCGHAVSHRKDWIKQRLLELSQSFAIEVGAFAIMDNHLHLLVRTQPDWADKWSDEEVARRWTRLYPRTANDLRQAAGITSEHELLKRLADDHARIAVWRQRLASLSWFMKCLKEPIARRANREDDVTGHFWEGRFKVQALLDETAVLTCLAYIDLNPIRAAVADTPERSNHTSIQDRIRVRQCLRAMRRRRGSTRRPKQIAPLVPLLAERHSVHDEDGIWLIPIERRGDRGRKTRSGLTELTLDEYLRLVDFTGRQGCPGKRGVVPKSLESILERLDVNTERWVEELLRHGSRFGTVIGSSASLAREAARRGTRWVVGACPVYRSGV